MRDWTPGSDERPRTAAVLGAGHSGERAFGGLRIRGAAHSRGCAFGGCSSGLRCTRAGNVPAVVGLGRNNPLTSGAAHHNAGRIPCACVRLQRGEMPPAAPAGSFTRGLSSPNESGPQKRSPQERRRQRGPSGSEIARRAAGARGAAPSGGSASPWRRRPVPQALSSARTNLGSCPFGSQDRRANCSRRRPWRSRGRVWAPGSPEDILLRGRRPWAPAGTAGAAATRRP